MPEVLGGIVVSNNPVNWFDPEGLQAGVGVWGEAGSRTATKIGSRALPWIANGPGAAGAIVIGGVIAATAESTASDDTLDAHPEAQPIPDEKCEEPPDLCKDDPCDPPAGEKYNITTHWTSHSEEPGKGSHGCEDLTGSPVHWHYSVMHQNPATCECFEERHAFGGCGPGPGV